MDAIILAGGQGSRMENELPKALVPARGKAILSWQIDYLLGSGVVDKIILSLGVKAQLIVEYIEKNYPGKPIEFAIEKEPLGTGGGLKFAMQHATSDKVLVFNCDDITNIDLNQLATYDKNYICVAHPELRFGLVKENEQGNAIFVEKPKLDEWVNCGWYLFQRNDIFPLLPDNGSIEYEVFPNMELKLHKHTGFWQPLNTKKDVKIFSEAELPSELL